jgi:hypothetical protein
MRINKIYILLGFLIAFGLFVELAAHADTTNEETKLTFSAPVQIPGQVLPAGTYVFELADSEASQNLVRIFNADRSVLYATLDTASAERREPGDTMVVLAQPENGQPEMLVKWFYPGNSTGHEFLYSKQQERQIANATKENLAGDGTLSSSDAGGN